jgi:hypothetical protein
LGQFGLTSRHSSQRNKKIKTPPTHKKKLNFYCHRTFGTFAFAANAQAIPRVKAKEPNLHPSITTFEL